ncbi:hypothetical protein N4P33_12855 [Streptomyces sp. 15-116A]|uniref:alkyl sulfatase C-terminal domain-containing protein n=1 Tax=Streptomyces sp. 15-116A TaxID=2259035 RepID=UPI0021B21229|nr:alkyl sulfatase C-terminal domain-containing protein [Streptomyces sp. 15-116A]MCT7353057.1 hypothetical protein [Streptomyces sp. 15-116A]
MTFDEAGLRAVLLGQVSPTELAAQGRARTSGDTAGLGELFSHLTAPDPDFAIVTP